VVDTASGSRSLSMHGAGTNRRIWMGLLQWEREVARQRGGEGASVLRLYDEPDVNLHPGAQRDLFATISGWANDPEAHTQCIVCTHAITMIDRAPLTAVRLLQTDEAGRRSVDRISAPGGEAQVRLLNEIGRAIGLSNSALLYERAFLVFEGPSEQAALPLLYRTLFSRTVAEDGIVLVNLDGCGGWKSVLDVLFRNRMQLVHLVLDEDCRGGDAGDRISVHDLEELGCRPDFLEQQITFVGHKEFEDSFPDHLIVRALQAELPREDGRHWQETDLQPARKGDKFSHELTRIAVAGCVREKKNIARKKPEIAAAIARHCAGDEIPAVIVRALTSIRQRAGLA
jgi:putative ATP-dependent endonuclease of OLD family